MGNPLKNTNGNLGEKTTQELMLIRFWRNWKDEMKTRQREKTS